MQFSSTKFRLAALVALWTVTTVSADDGVDIFTLEPSTAVPMVGGTFEVVGTAGQSAAGMPLLGGGFELRGGFWGVILNDVFVVLWVPSPQSDFFNPLSWTYEGGNAGVNELPTESDVVKLTPVLDLPLNLMPVPPRSAVIGGLQVLFAVPTGGVARFNLANTALVLSGVTEPSSPSLLVRGGASGLTEAKFESFNASGTDQLATLSVGLDSTGIGGLGRLRLSSAGMLLYNDGDLIAGVSGRGELIVETGADAITLGGAFLGSGPGARGDAYVRNPGSLWQIMGDTLAVGGQGVGNVFVQDGAELLANTSLVTIGQSSSATGAVTVSDPDSTLEISSGALTVGDGGNGTLTIENGARFVSGSLSQLSLGTGAGTIGTLELGTSGSADVDSTRIAIGDEGTGFLIIGDGAVLTTTVLGFAPIDVGAQDGSTGFVSIIGAGSRWTETTSIGQLRVGVQGAGSVVLNGGTLDIPQVTIYPNGSISGNGTIDGSVFNVGNIGVSSGGSGGQLSITGGYQQAALGGDVAGTLSAVAGSASAAPVGVVCNGNADLSGGLSITSGPTAPNEGDSFTVVSAATINGHFDVTFVDGIPDLRADVQYLAADRKGGGSDVTITFQPLPNSSGLGGQSAESISFLPSAGTLGDVDANGEPDLILSIPSGTAGGGSGLIEVVLNLTPDGSGGLLNSGVVDVPAGTQLTAVASGDLDGDGLNDVIAANGVSNGGLVVFKSTGSGLIPWPGPAFPLMNSPDAVATASLNGDGIADLIVACMGDSTVRVLLSGGGVFSQQTINVPVASVPCSVDPSDFDGDGDIDFAVALAASSKVQIFLNNGNGTFASAPGIDLAVGTKPIQVIARDVDQVVPEGYSAPLPDLITVDKIGGTVSVLINQTGQQGGGPGSPVQFSNAVSLPVGLDPRSAVFLDDDEDGDLDMVVAVTDRGVQTARKVRNDLANLQASFNAGGSVPASEGARLLLDGDLDHDGLPDLLVITADGGVASDSFVIPTSARVSPNVMLVLGDLNGDGSVGGADLAIMLGGWGLCQNCVNCTGDLDGNCTVDAADLAVLLGNWGTP